MFCRLLRSSFEHPVELGQRRTELGAVVRDQPAQLAGQRAGVRDDPADRLAAASSTCEHLVAAGEQLADAPCRGAATTPVTASARRKSSRISSSRLATVAREPGQSASASRVISGALRASTLDSASKAVRDLVGVDVLDLGGQLLERRHDVDRRRGPRRAGSSYPRRRLPGAGRRHAEVVLAEQRLHLDAGAWCSGPGRRP